ncbi:MAG: hypothetical protein QME66_02875 [Candidatus Eisenbacteria bacterium]|nr:hypothetical protein [Candidatus Eisenbacteria bacterium]
MGTFEDMKKGVVNFYVGLAGKSSETAKIGMKKLDIVGVRRSIADEERALGKKVKELIADNSPESITANKEVLAFVEKIRKLEQDILSKEAEIEEIRKAKKPQAPAG